MYVLPGFVDCHGHTGGAAQGTTAEYVYKLWLAHGVTTVREPGSFNGLDWTLNERARSARNEITAPRIFAYVAPGAGWGRGPLRTPELAREYVRWAKQKGVDGFKVIGDGPIYDPEIMAAFLDEANKLGLVPPRILINSASRGSISCKRRDSACARWSIGTGYPKRSLRIDQFKTSRSTITTATNRIVSARRAVCGDRLPRPVASGGTR